MPCETTRKPARFAGWQSYWLKPLSMPEKWGALVAAVAVNLALLHFMASALGLWELYNAPYRSTGDDGMYMISAKHITEKGVYGLKTLEHGQVVPYLGRLPGYETLLSLVWRFEKD